MNKELLSFIKKINRNTAKDFLSRSHPQSISYNSSNIFLISIKGLGEPDIMLMAEGFRQILLSRIPGYAITRIRIRYKNINDRGEATLVPVLHKYGYIPGVVENIREIIGNLQKGIFNLAEKDEPLDLECTFFKDIPVSSHYKEFLLGEWVEEDEADIIINPEQKILTFQDKGFHVCIEFTIEKWVGFKKAEDVKRDEMAETRGNPDVLSLTLDANFNPTKRAGYRIQEETLQFEIETNGAVSPFEAYETAYALFSEEFTRNKKSI
jgi:DNA-directed RNA polymerase alpha subunit|tara:strand:+ start:1494 stop:2291 length:798 start_codon:yes stop_codon:yes gene_type:complete